MGGPEAPARRPEGARARRRRPVDGLPADAPRLPARNRPAFAPRPLRLRASAHRRDPRRSHGRGHARTCAVRCNARQVEHVQYPTFQLRRRSSIRRGPARRLGEAILTCPIPILGGSKRWLTPWTSTSFTACWSRRWLTTPSICSLPPVAMFSVFLACWFSCVLSSLFFFVF